MGLKVTYANYTTAFPSVCRVQIENCFRKPLLGDNNKARYIFKFPFLFSFPKLELLEHFFNRWLENYTESWSAFKSVKNLKLFKTAHGSAAMIKQSIFDLTSASTVCEVKWKCLNALCCCTNLNFDTQSYVSNNTSQTQVEFISSFYVWFWHTLWYILLPTI